MGTPQEDRDRPSVSHSFEGESSEGLPSSQIDKKKIIIITVRPFAVNEGLTLFI